MSAFMCSPQCFRNAAQVICSQDKTLDVARVVRQLVALNQYSLDCRYGDYNGNIGSQEAREERTETTLRACRLTPSSCPVQLLKSIKSLRYQCAEGDAMNQEEFKALDQLCNRLEESTTYTKQQYDAAIWG